jgi:Protein of unknown function, DUF547
MKGLRAVTVWLSLYSLTFGMEAWESNYTGLLQKYVKASGVQYSVWKKNSSDLQALKEIINQIGAGGPSSQEREAQLAYYINAYNALVLAGVLDRYPLRSVRDVAPFYGFFTENNIIVAGKRTSLYALERKLLIPRFQEPRIHFALNCASRSCPPLRSEAYTAARLDEQLNEMTRGFLDNSSEAVKPVGSGYAVSKIFDWYKDGFVASGGTVGFINKYRKEMIPPNAKISLQDYNWNLNEAK